LATKATYDAPSDTNAGLPTTCKARKLAYFVRHGSRYPTESNVKAFAAMTVALHNKSALINANYTWMGKWESRFTPGDAGELNAFGCQQTYEIAKRFVKRFPELFALPYKPSRYEITSSIVSRALRSAETFAFALFEGRGEAGGTNGTTFVAPFIVALPEEVEKRAIVVRVCVCVTFFVSTKD
jgi:hypothetical protein